MHICRFDVDRIGIVENGRVFDVTEAVKEIQDSKWPPLLGDPLFLHFDQVVAAATRLKATAVSRPLSEVKLYSLITAPTKIMAAPANYRAHFADTEDAAVDAGIHAKSIEGVDRPAEKLGLFLKASSSIAGPAEGISLAMKNRRNDPEIELVVVIGKTGKNIPKARAYDYIAGYCLGIDSTVRGSEDRSYRKSADSYALVGPWITTRDTIPDPEAVTIWLDVNGTRRQTSSTGLMIVKIAELIEMASKLYTLYPGDLIYTGTPAGVSEIREGDVLRAGCDEIGEMTLQVH